MSAKGSRISGFRKMSEAPAFWCFGKEKRDMAKRVKEKRRKGKCSNFARGLAQNMEIMEDKGMEKELDRKTLVLQEDENIGAVQIADDVVSMIASLAASEVEGVATVGGNLTNELMSKVGVKNLGKGVKVDVKETNVVVGLIVTMEYGYNIPATSRKVQDKVKAAIENMTGLNCTEVNIRISGVKLQ